MSFALLFPGGGTQYAGMGRALYSESSIARDVFQEANDVLGYDLTGIIFNGPLATLSQMEHSQPAILTASVAAFRVFNDRIGILPAYACGHSLGEYSALTCASVLPFSDVVKLVRKRGELLQQTGERYRAGMMAVNKLDVPTIERECTKINEEGEDKVFISAFNSPLQSVISGTDKGLLKLKQRLEDLKAHVTILNINTPSHCPLMTDALQEFKEALAQCNFKEPRFKVVSNLLAKPYATVESIAGTLLDHMVRPVRWYESVRYVTENGVTSMIDVGPQAVLSQLNQFIDPGISNFGLETSGGYDGVKEAVMRSRASFIKKCLVTTISSRNYNDNRQEYHDGVEVSYKKLRELSEQSVIQTSDLEVSFGLLIKVLETKKVPVDHAEKTLSEMQELLTKEL